MRRWFCFITVLFALSPLTAGQSAWSTDLEPFVASWEQALGGRIGVTVVGINADREWHYRAHERFPMMSTFKTLACAHILTLAEKGTIDPNQTIQIRDADLVPYAPVTSKLVGGAGLSLLDLCEATLRTSDNVAANLILRATGGPDALTAYIRTLGDTVTRLDRWEVELNEAASGDPRDTTTPTAMASLLRLLLLDGGLSPLATQQLSAWMKANAVSDALLRSALPTGWSIADRSGAGQNGSRAIAAVVWDKVDNPYVVTIYITQAQADMAELNQTIAAIGHRVFSLISEKISNNP